MKSIDSPALASSLAGLAELFDKKPITPAAFKVWFETLKEFPIERVIWLLNAWPKTHGKFPVPAEIWKTINDAAIDEREHKAKVDEARRVNELKTAARSPQGERVIKLIAEILKRQKLSPLEHWERVLATEGLPQISYDFARECLLRIRRPEPSGREPGQDDEELDRPIPRARTEGRADAEAL